MMPTNLRRTGALLVSAALLASLTVAAVAAPASAAKPKCAGKTATIVGTSKGEVIRGTKKADVIVARGGHDRIYGRGGNDTICGGGGHDKIVGARGNDLIFGGLGQDNLYGGAGRDRLLGGPANDRLAGGPGNDACLQGAGSGLHLGCERPAIPTPVVPVTPPPPPKPEPKTLVIAYSDLDDSDTFNAGDVMIAKIVDTNADGIPSKDDTIKMGRYPVAANPTSPVQFLSWRVGSHIIEAVMLATGALAVETMTGGAHQWAKDIPGSYFDAYSEQQLVAQTSHISVIADYVSSNPDAAGYDELSPSKPSGTFTVVGPGTGDDPLIEVEFFWGGSIL